MFIIIDMVKIRVEILRIYIFKKNLKMKLKWNKQNKPINHTNNNKKNSQKYPHEKSWSIFWFPQESKNQEYVRNPPC